jgi:hypothetical protein
MNWSFPPYLSPTVSVDERRGQITFFELQIPEPGEGGEPAASGNFSVLFEEDDEDE